jgi:hypothetical protein
VGESVSRASFQTSLQRRYGGIFVNARESSNTGIAPVEHGLNSCDDGVIGLVWHDLLVAMVTSLEEVGLADALMVDGCDDDAMESREEGASSRKLQSRSFFLQFSHIGWVQSHCLDGQLAELIVRF